MNNSSVSSATASFSSSAEVSQEQPENGTTNFLQKLKKTSEGIEAKAVPGLTTAASTPHTISHIHLDSTTMVQHESRVQPTPTNSSTVFQPKSLTPYRMSQFEKILNADTIDMTALRNISWNGIPSGFRPDIWKMLIGYLPVQKERRDDAMRRKRNEYLDCLPVYFKIADLDRTTLEGEIHRQILVDLPRTCPDNPFFHQQSIRKAMERILYIWSIRHPASGYVQGMNDILTPILFICAQGFVGDPQRCDFGGIDIKILNNIEADSYWCFTRLMDNIQDHYTFSQPGLQRMILRLEDLIRRIDKELHEHLQNEGMQYIQFCFRWMNCVLIREFSLKVIVRIWDTYFSEGTGGFENFHVYVCAVILKTFRDKLLTMSFQDMFMYLQDMPTNEWDEDEVEPILAQAFILKSLFENSPSHLG